MVDDFGMDYRHLCSPLFRYDYLLADMHLIREVLLPFFRERNMVEATLLWVTEGRDVRSWRPRVNQIREAPNEGDDRKWFVLPRQAQYMSIWLTYSIGGMGRCPFFAATCRIYRIVSQKFKWTCTAYGVHRLSWCTNNT